MEIESEKKEFSDDHAIEKQCTTPGMVVFAFGLVSGMLIYCQDFQIIVLTSIRHILCCLWKNGVHVIFRGY
jgi:hypothetical protein